MAKQQKQRHYSDWPFRWDHKRPETIQNDRRWLESIVRNAAPFSDWWTKARIVQLAYPLPPNTRPQTLYELPVYGGITSEAEIALALRGCCDLLDEYPEFARQVDENYVIETLNAWKTKQFSLAIGRNFDLYAHRQFPNVFLAVSTAPVSLNVDRILPPIDQFRPLFNIDELAAILRDRDIQRVTLRTHGYSNPAKSFYANFDREATALNQHDSATHDRTLQPDHCYIGYHWPSEKPIVSPGLWADYRNVGILLKFLFVLSGLAGIVGTLLYVFLRLIGLPLLNWIGKIPAVESYFSATNFWETAALAVRGYWLIPTVFMLWVLAFLMLRIVVYQRDRYRAIHYGAPDLAEFFWRLDRSFRNYASQRKEPISGEVVRPRELVTVNLVGHSMGALVLVNVLRILSDRFGKDDIGSLKPDTELAPGRDPVEKMGRYLLLDKLILASPDIPLEFLREGRNNYVRSAMRRCRRIYLMSSDRDIVLRYLSTVGNWFGEPSMQMAGLRLGNVYLKRLKNADLPFRPYIRIMLHSERAVRPTSSYELFLKFNYLDCSRMGGGKASGGVNVVPLPMNHITALPIDLINTLFYLLGLSKLDVHGGYFQTQTRSFQIFKFLLTANTLKDEEIRAEIDRIKGQQIRFLPSQRWEMPAVSQPVDGGEG
ncbi:alpha/beta hydrolase [Microcoleus sp. FACHB-1515]|uniref:alpha/beta hydrolase n=1 Tax=Cyanophyceae TaxID=3028117 RepID=UPI001685274F|nr:alpha/beta hydrolase [Microcoleus sp. FACHB-1515]MBD2089161.1 alpha/beta hydrolase [Microcoleus sp. FACHB-1515]